MSTEPDVDALADALRTDPEAREKVVDAIVQEMNVDTETEEGAAAQSYRRDVLKALGLAGTAAVAGGAASTALTEPASASHGGGTIGTSSDPLEMVHTEALSSLDSLTTGELDNAPRIYNGDDVQAKIDEAGGGGTVVIPAGETVSVSSQLVYPNNLHIVQLGETGGLDTSGITDGSDVLVPDPNASWPRIFIDNLRIIGGGSEGHGLVIQDSGERCVIKDLRVEGVGGDGVRDVAGLAVHLYNPEILDCGGVGVRARQDGGGTTLYIHGGKIKRNQKGVKVEAVASSWENVVLRDTVIESNMEQAILAEDYINLGVRGCYFENNDQNGVATGIIEVAEVNSSSYNTFIGPRNLFGASNASSSATAIGGASGTVQGFTVIRGNYLNGGDIDLNPFLGGNANNPLVAGWNHNQNAYINEPEYINEWGVAKEAAGTGNSPTSTKWPVGIVVENTSDSTVWLHTDAGTWVQLG